MKLLYLLVATIVAIMFGSCSDVIFEPYKDGVIPTTDQKVLLIDYTGYKCGNCPKAAKEASRLKALYGDQLVVMTVHNGFRFAMPSPDQGYIEDFRTITGEGLFDFLGILSQPIGTVNFVNFDGSLKIGFTGWSSAISKELRKTPAMSITISPQFTTDSILTIKTEVKFKKASTGNHRLAVYLIEDSIMYQQLDYDYNENHGIKQDYIHRHVLRGTISAGKLDTKYDGEKSVAGAFGESLPATVANATTSKTYSISLKGTTWNLKNCSVIVNVNDKATNNTLQVAEAHILK